MEILQNIFHSYSLSLQLLSDPYHVVYDHYNKIRFCNQEKGGFESMNGDDGFNRASTNIHNEWCDNNNIDLGKGIYERASHLLHSCNPCCRVNVIDEKGTIEIRSIMDIPSSNIPLTRNFLDDTRGTGISYNDEEFVRNFLDDTRGTGISYNDEEFVRNLINDDINLIPCNIRCKEILSNYHFICKCPKCLSWDKLRGLLCCNASNSNGCKGILWSRPPYLLWKCQSCQRLVNKESLFTVLKFEKTAIQRLRGIEEIINYNFSKSIDVSSLLYPLLNDCSNFLSSNHWIIIRLLWICFEEKLSRNHLPQSLLYLRRHIESAESVNNYNSNPSIIMANKYELISDLLSYHELYKQESIKKAIKLRILINGKQHSSVKRCQNKLKYYQDQSLSL